MTIITDSIQVKNGTDFSFVCGKVPFAISCSSTLKHGAYNLIDLDLVNKMKIPLQKIKVCRMTYLGENVRSVGYIDQTVHCVQKGVIQGTVHLAAKVVRNLFDTFNVDCVASSKTFERLTGNKPPDPPDFTEAEDDQKQLDNDHNHNKADKAKEISEEEEEDQQSTCSSSSSISTRCSDGYHDPLSHTWLFQASLLAQAAQMDDNETLLDIAEGLANNDHHRNQPEVYVDTDEDSNDTDTKTEDEEDSDWSEIPDMHCDLCFRAGQPVKIVTSHSNECPTCPTLTLKQKEAMFGSDWKARAERIFRKRFQREQERKKGNADQ